MRLGIVLVAGLTACDAALVDAPDRSLDQQPRTSAPATPPYQDVYMPVPAPDLQLVWSFDVSVLGNFELSREPILVGQLTDDDGSGTIDGNDDPDMVLGLNSLEVGSPSRTLYVVDAMTMTLHWSHAGVDLESPVAMADLDFDGELNLVFQTSDSSPQIRSLNADGTLHWSVPDTSSGWFDNLVVGDALPATAGLEVLAENVLISGVDGSVIQGLPASPQGGQVEMGDLDLDGSVEVVVGNTAYDPATGTAKWSSSLSGAYPHRLTMVGDGTGTGGLLALAGHQLTLTDAVGNLVHQNTLPGGGTPSQDAWCVGDPDGDGGVEIVRTYEVSNVVTVAAYELDGTENWSKVVSGANSLDGGCASADLDGDGDDEVTLHTEGGLVVLGGNAGALKASLPALTGTAVRPTVADLDGDGDPEFVRVARKVIEVYDEVNGVWDGPVDASWFERDHAPGKHGDLGVQYSANWFDLHPAVRGN